MNLDDGRRLFTVSELWGPLHCKQCRREAWTIVLSPEDNASLPEQSGPQAVVFIFTNGLGTVFCDEHLLAEIGHLSPQEEQPK
jgi:hypothetical protein